MASARAIAADILLAVIDQGKSLNPLLELRLTGVAENERGFVSALCYGSLRWYTRLDGWLSQLMSKPLKTKDRDLHMVLICGLYQLAYMQKPAHAAINETVNVSRELDKQWASKLLNGVLRNFTRRQQELRDWADRTPEHRYAFPAWLIKRIRQAYPEQYESLLAGLNEQAPMTLRVNARINNRAHYQQLLEQEQIKAIPTRLAEFGLALDVPCDVNQLPGFFDPGRCSVQDEAAQLASQLLPLQPGQRILDACSAPGGKTAALLERCPELAEVVAVDQDPERQQRTRETLDRLGLQARVLVADTADLDAWWDGRQFDAILLDAPCSATGVIRRHPDIKHLRKDQDIHQLSRIQSRLLETLWRTLKPGGRLLYATCSILPQENTHIIERFMQGQPQARLVEAALPAELATTAGYQLLPSVGGGDGFFYALLEKAAQATE